MGESAVSRSEFLLLPQEQVSLSRLPPGHSSDLQLSLLRTPSLLEVLPSPRHLEQSPPVSGASRCSPLTSQQTSGGDLSRMLDLCPCARLLSMVLDRRVPAPQSPACTVLPAPAHSPGLCVAPTSSSAFRSGSQPCVCTLQNSKTLAAEAVQCRVPASSKRVFLPSGAWGRPSLFGDSLCNLERKTIFM